MKESGSDNLLWTSAKKLLSKTFWRKGLMLWLFPEKQLNKRKSYQMRSLPLFWMLNLLAFSSICTPHGTVWAFSSFPQHEMCGCLNCWLGEVQSWGGGQLQVGYILQNNVWVSLVVSHSTSPPLHLLQTSWWALSGQWLGKKTSQTYTLFWLM